MNAIEFTDVSFAYPHQPIFRQLNLAIAMGDFVALAGRNGAGKSTFLKLCVRQLVPDSGDIFICGESVKTYRNWHKIGYVPQNPLRDRAFPITVAEVVAMGHVPGLGFGRRLRSSDQAAIRNALRLTGVEALQAKMLGNLSGGQQQRVMVARALAAEPDMLILDEPTAGIDARGAEEFYRLLQQLNQASGITVLLVSHDLERVAVYAKTMLCFDEGVKYQGPAGLYRRKPGAGGEINARYPAV